MARNSTLALCFKGVLFNITYRDLLWAMLGQYKLKVWLLLLLVFASYIELNGKSPLNS
jgi:hypothetical protein